ANVVADALSKKSGMIAGIKVEEEIIRDLELLDIELYVRGQHGYCASLRVKIEHQRASGLLQPLDIPVWKWDEISMDFVTGLPRTQRRHDAIWVVVDRLTKSAHFLPIRKDYSVSRLAEIFQQEIVTNEEVVVAKEKVKEARTRQKSYADKHRKSLEF
nr:retrotransposon protein, putative, Ty3-gypsy subclass [Tanacetum cinerariifolium]